MHISSISPQSDQAPGASPFRDAIVLTYKGAVVSDLYQARLAPPARPNLACGHFDRLLALAADSKPLETMRAYVREPEHEIAMISG